MKYLSWVVLLLLVLLPMIYFLYPKTTSVTGTNLTSFTSDQDFKSYIALSESYFGPSGYYYGSSSISSARSLDIVPSQVPMPLEGGLGEQTSGYTEPERYSETNVQVQGIDEPDIVKTDGQNIFFSSQGFRDYWLVRSFDYIYYDPGETSFISAFPPENITLEYQSDKSGDLLLYNNTLVIFTYDSIYGYDVSDTSSPEISWTIKLNSSLTTARLYNGKIYLVTRSWINNNSPCPVPLLMEGSEQITIPCTRIYHPIYPIDIDNTYNAVVVDPVSGEVENSISFVGSSGYSVVYMSTNAIYITYPIYQDQFSIYYDLVMEKFTDLLPSNTIQRIQRVAGYDISYQAKLVELQVTISEYMSDLQAQDENAYYELMEEYQKRTEQYFSEHKRDLQKTGVVKIGFDMVIEASTDFPGTLLNQFSMDEYEDHLRVATTVTNQYSWSWDDWANDIYVMDSNLNPVGSITDLGLGERIYSARFLGEKGYLVTFREIDPFFVLDLSNPSNPEVKGELEIPGYSSYLHPVGDDKVLGIGREESNVKLSLFDVSSPENPTELSKLQIAEYWSDVLNTHHAFLLDSEHEIFFLPAGDDGYVFSYSGDELSQVNKIEGINANRAIYIDDYLYVIGDYSVIVLDENTWNEISSLEISTVI